MYKPRFVNLAQWLAWQETLHPKTIDLGLERLRFVLERLGFERPPFTVISVAGTNGKGSCVAFLEAMLRAGGYRVGAYTSPHLLRYNERIRVDGEDASDAALCDAFARIDAARGEISLTYFEFGTLAAFLIFQDAGVRVAVLEVGLGGRLDAVNVLDADAALITSIGIDHVEWLGPDRESIGREKAGIFRAGRPAVCADPDPPQSVLAQAEGLGAPLYRVGRDYGFERYPDHWIWRHDAECLRQPLPALPGDHQIGNAAAALMTLTCLANVLPLDRASLAAGLRGAQAPGRFQIIPGPIEWILDVTHNPHGAVVLAQCLTERFCSGRTLAVLGMLDDKDAAGVARSLDFAIDGWYVAGLPKPRGCSGEALAGMLRAAGVSTPVTHFPDVEAACRAAAAAAGIGDRIVVFGSFYTVAGFLAAGLPDRISPPRSKV